MKYKEIEGNLITLALDGEFDVIAHGCNCFCTMGAGLAPQMAKAFGCDLFPLENSIYKGDINKLGQIDYEVLLREPLGDGDVVLPDEKVTLNNWKSIYPFARFALAVVNCYSQYGFGINHKEGSVAPLDYAALELCFKKMNHIFQGKHIGLPQIGCHLAGGDWNIVKSMIQKEFKDCTVTVVIFNNK